MAQAGSWVWTAGGCPEGSHILNHRLCDLCTQDTEQYIKLADRSKLSADRGRRKHYCGLAAAIDTLLHCRSSIAAPTMQTHDDWFDLLQQAEFAAQLYLLAHSHATL